jgi:hypothetical protein
MYFRGIAYLMRLERKLLPGQYTSIVDKLARLAKPLQVSAGNVLYAHEEKTDMFFVVLRGELTCLLPKTREVLSN